jgi:hypothetical protein
MYKAPDWLLPIRSAYQYLFERRHGDDQPTLRSWSRSPFWFGAAFTIIQQSSLSIGVEQ